MSNTPTLFDPATRLQIKYLRREICGLARAQKRSPDSNYAFYASARLTLLNELCGRKNCHAITRADRASDKNILDHMLAGIRQSPPAMVDGPLRVYVVNVVTQHALINEYGRLTTRSKDPLSLSDATQKILKQHSQAHTQSAHALATMIESFHDHPRVMKWLAQDKTLVNVSGNVYQHMWNGFPPIGVSFKDQSLAVAGRELQPLARAYLPLTLDEAQAAGLTDYPLL